MAAALVGAALAAGVVELAHRGWSVHTSKSARPVLARTGFHLTYPSNWTPVTVPAAPAPAGRGIAALREAGGKGLVIVRREKASRGVDAAFVKDLDRRLRRQIPDYRPVRAQILHLKSGEALFYSYIRQTQGLLATITVIPAGNHSFAIDTVSPANDKRIAKDIGQIIRSFTAT